MELAPISRNITILVVDDEPGVRRGLRMRLGREPYVTVVGEADDGPSAVRMAQHLRPDVVILDVALPGQDGIATAEILQTSAPTSTVVMPSLYDDATTHDRATSAGAACLVGKHEPITRLLTAIRKAAKQAESQR